MFLPSSLKDMKKSGYDECDVIIVTPDAYVDHPSFGMALLGRFLERNGYRVGILSQPKWKDPESFLKLGVPRIAFAISGGQMDSMVLNYTATKKPRKEDLFCEGGNPFFSKKGEGKKYRIRPDRVLNVYCSQIKSVCKEKPVIIGGIEASLRRTAHYDYWSGKVRRSILFDSKADMLIYGMGEYPLLDAVRAFESGIPIDEMRIKNSAVPVKSTDGYDDFILLPSYEDVKNSKDDFAKAHLLFEKNRDRKVLFQKQDSRYMIQYPSRRISQEELDFIYESRFMRKPHPDYHDIPAFEMIKNSITSHRGCFGNCSFCSIATHQGPEVISRSRNSILNEVKAVADMDYFKGTISDIGGPSANMYAAGCSAEGCDRHDCLKGGHGCKNLISGNREYISLLENAGKIKGVRHVFVNSGLRFDPCLMDKNFLETILKNHISGQMKVAPESGSDKVLKLMNKPVTAIFSEFLSLFNQIKKKEGIRKYVIPYIIIGHPGESEKESEETAEFLFENNLKGKQFQIFTPTPGTRSTAMYYLGFDPLTGEKTVTEKNIRKLEMRKEKTIRKIS
ncbi:MAG: YgiQ family radical SAM protein [Euryarchaeota archaeon]|nr:YgiQ family radical SAM protein [Euryarchaeota archaeon]